MNETWTNAYTKDFWATSLKQFRQNWLYNHFDPRYRQMLRGSPTYTLVGVLCCPAGQGQQRVQGSRNHGHLGTAAAVG